LDGFSIAGSIERWNDSQLEETSMASSYRASDASSPAFVPDPYRPEIAQARIEHCMTPGERHQLIAEIAYLIAERRGFAPGQELSDWLAAEQEVNRRCGLIEPLPRWDG